MPEQPPPQAKLIKLPGLSGENQPPSYRLESTGLYLDLPQSEPQRICQGFDLQRLISQRGVQEKILLRFLNLQGDQQHLVFGRSELLGSTPIVVRKLLDRGFTFSSLNQKLLRAFQTYLLHCDITDSCQNIEKCGWNTGVFIQPDLVIGGDPALFFLETSSNHHGLLDQHQDTHAWRHAIAAQAVGNPLLIFLLSLAFTPVLLKPLKLPSIGIHLWGKSSTGKSILGRMCNSVWGAPERVRSWNMSPAGLEHLMRSYQDTLLILDEISEVRSHSLSNLIYQMGNGISRSLADLNNDMFSLAYFSSGEKSLANLINDIHTEPMTGQYVRLINLPVSCGGRFGVLDTLHQHPSPGAFMEQLDRLCRENYGAVIVDFIETFVQQESALLLKQFDAYCATFLDKTVGSTTDGITRRVARHFSLCGFAGDLATQWGLTGWPADQASSAAQQLFHLWKEQFQNFTYTETDHIKDHVDLFLRNHHDHFIAIGETIHGPMAAKEVFGYRADIGQGRHYYILASIFTQQLLKGWDKNKALQLLTNERILIPDPETQKPYRSMRFSTAYGSRVHRVYQLVRTSNQRAPARPSLSPLSNLEIES